MTQIFDATQCKLGEGPTYDPIQNLAWWFDIEANRLFEHEFGAGKTRQFELPKMASMLGVIDSETQLVACEDGLYVRNRGNGTLELNAPLEPDKPLNRSNDGRVHPSGALWIGTMSKQMEKGAGAIYCYYKGELRQLYTHITVPNAICFSPDGELAYFTDTPTRKLMRVRLDPRNGLPSEAPELFFDHADNPGWQDGAIVDDDGNLWNACWHGACVVKISDQGDLLESHPVPALQPTCPVFVGKHLDTMLVTSAWVDLDEGGKRTSDDGKTFRLDVAVKGKPEPRVLLK